MLTETFCLFIGLVPEDRGACDKDVGACLEGQVDVVEFDAAVDLEVCREAFFRDIGAGGADLVEGLGHHLLAAESGLNRHDQEHIHLVHVGDDCLEGGLWFDRDADLAVVFADLIDHGLRVLCGLQVEGDEVGAGGGKFADIADGIHDHEVDVKDHVGGAADRLDDGHAEGDGGHEESVHDVDVQVGGAALFHGGDLLAQAFEIRRQNRGGQFEFGIHSFLLLFFSFLRVTDTGLF